MTWQPVTLKSVLAKSKDFDCPDTAKEFGLSYIIECFICEKEELADRGVWPEGWKEVKKYNYKLCPGCAKKLQDWVKGGSREKRI